MIRALAVACFLSACGVAETGLLLTVPGKPPPTSMDGGIDTGPVYLDFPTNFGAAAIGGIYSKPYRIRNGNAGPVDIRLLRVEGTPGVFGIEFFGEDEVRTLEPGGAIDGDVLYLPQEGTEQATFVFNTCAGPFECIKERAVVGFALDHAFRCEGGDVGALPVGECLFANVSCTNVSDYHVFLDGIGWSGSGAFLPTAAPNGELAPDQSFSIEVQFCPATEGEHILALELHAAVPGGRNVTAYWLEGEGIFPGQSLRCTSRNVSLGPIPVGSSDSVFVTCTTDEANRILSAGFELGNVGLSAQLQVNNMVVVPPITVTPSDQIGVEIVFSPPSAGEYFDAFSIVTDADWERIEVTAVAIADGCQVMFDPIVDFGAVPIGTVQNSGFFEIFNVGVGSCTVGSIGFAPGSDPAFTVNQFTATLIPGSSLGVSAEFAPMRNGLHTGTFLFEVNELLMQYAVDFRGNGIGGTSDGYSITAVPNSALSPIGGTPLSFNNEDDGVVTIGIGFPFEFDGQPVTNAYVSTNGLVSFVNTLGIDTWFNAAIPAAQEPNAFIAWWWDDLHTDHPQGPPSTISTALDGMMGAQVRSFTFTNVTGYGDNSPIVNAEVRLFEGTNEIEVHYGPITQRGADFNGTVGWESFGGSEGADALGCGPNCAATNWPTDTILRYVPMP